MDKRDKIFFSLIIVCILMVTYLVMYMKGEGGQCLRNPYVYGASKMENVQCSCTQLKQFSTCPAKFYFNDTFFDAGITNCGTDDGKTMNIDFGKLKFNVTE